MLPLHIAAKELVPVVLAAATWGHTWRGLNLHCSCDNEVVVIVINKGSAKDSNQFLSSSPQAHITPSPPPVKTLQLITESHLSWTLHRWRKLFRASLNSA